MAITLEANYAKKLGLPNYSSHQYSVTIRTELTDLAQVEAESARLYRLLQDAVDREIEEVGFLPDATTYGMHPAGSNGGSGNSSAGSDNGSHRTGSRTDEDGSAWRCSDKQREFIQKIVAEKHLDKNDVEALAQQMFGAGVRQLNRLEASGLIDELLERHGGGRRNGTGRNDNGGGYRRAKERRSFARSTSAGGGE
jgi:hypothetical protein